MPHGVQYICYVDDTGYYLGSVDIVGEYLGLNETTMSSTWVPAHADGNLSLIRVQDVRSLWTSLGQLAQRFAIMNAGSSMDQTIHLFMPCGTLTRFISFDDLPWSSLQCPCGDSTHWVIWYTGQAPKA